MAAEIERGCAFAGGGRVPAAPRRRALTVARGLRLLLAILVGVLVYTALERALEVLLGIEAPAPAGGEKLTAQLVALVVAGILTGYAAAWVAGGWELFAGLATGGLLGWGAGSAALYWQGVPQPLDQLLGLLVLLPAAALGAVLRRTVAERRRAARAERAPLGLPVEIGPRPLVVWTGLLLALGMTGTAAWMIAAGLGEPPVWSALVVFGGGSLLLAWAAVRRGPHLVFHEEGIDDRRLGVLIPWSEVEGASLSKVHPIEFVRFHIRDADRYLAMAQLSPVQELIQGWAKTRGEDLGITAIGSRFTAEELCELINSRAALLRG